MNNFIETRKIQQLSNKTTLIVTIPKSIALYMGLEKTDSLKFKVVNGKVVIEKC